MLFNNQDKSDGHCKRMRRASPRKQGGEQGASSEGNSIKGGE
jgi:hypothetical protein